jgi:hypothetical protein
VRQLAGRAGCGKRPRARDGQEGCATGRAVEFLRFVNVSPEGRFVYAGAIRGSGLRPRPTDGRRPPVPRPARLGDRGRRGRMRARPRRAVHRGHPLHRRRRFAYSASAKYDAVAVFRRDRATRALTQLRGRAGCLKVVGIPTPAVRTCASARGLHTARGVTLSPDERFLYVASIGDAVAVFRRDRRTGALRQLRGRAGCVTEDGGRAAAPRGSSRALTSPPSTGRSAPSTSPRTSASAAWPSCVRDRRTGALRQLPGAAGCVAPGGRGGCLPGRRSGGLHYVVLSPDGRFAYAAGELSRALVVYRLAGGRRGRD